MDDFYKQIRDSLNGLPEPSFRNKDWNALSAEMRSRKLNPLAFWSWLAVPLLLLTGNVAYWQYHKGNTGRSDHLLSQSDTVYITRTITLRDTVFLKGGESSGLQLRPFAGQEAGQVRKMQAEIRALKQQLAEVSRQQRIVNNKAVWAAAPQKDTALRHGIPAKNVSSDLLRVTISDRDSSSVRPSDQVFEDRAVTELHFRSYVPLESPMLAGLPLRRPDNTSTPVRRSLLWDNLAEEFSEIRFNALQLGAGTGLFYPSFGNGDFQVGKMVGLQGLVHLTRHFQLESNLAYQHVVYETEDLAETGGFLPVAPAEDERFLKVEAPFKALQWDLGLNYAFNRDGKLQPKLGLAYGLLYYYQNELSYEYENVENGIAWSVEDGGNFNGFNANVWLFKAGADYHLNREWVLGLGGLYRVVSGSDSYLTPSYWSLGLGLRYKF